MIQRKALPHLGARRSGSGSYKEAFPDEDSNRILKPFPWYGRLCDGHADRAVCASETLQQQSASICVVLNHHSSAWAELPCGNSSCEALWPWPCISFNLFYSCCTKLAVHKVGHRLSTELHCCQQALSLLHLCSQLLSSKWAAEQKSSLGRAKEQHIHICPSWCEKLTFNSNSSKSQVCNSGWRPLLRSCCADSFWGN